MDGLIDWSFNRSFMIELNYVYQWVETRHGLRRAQRRLPAFELRFQLIDTESSSLSFNFKTTSPNQEVGVTQDYFCVRPGGIEDLVFLPWPGTDGTLLQFQGFRWTYAAGSGRRKNNYVAYDASIAKTLHFAGHADLGQSSLVPGKLRPD